MTFTTINMNLATENAKLRKEIEILSEAVNDGGLNYERLLSDAKTEAQRYKQALTSYVAMYGPSLLHTAKPAICHACRFDGLMFYHFEARLGACQHGVVQTVGGDVCLQCTTDALEEHPDVDTYVVAGHAHECPEWDFLLIDDTMREYEACLCFKALAR